MAPALCLCLTCRVGALTVELQLRDGMFVSMRAIRANAPFSLIDRILQRLIDHPCAAARRRRLLWFLRFFVVCMCVGWTILVAHAPHDFSAVAFSGGLCILCVLMHGLDYPDVVNYSDVVRPS
jgi:hypothetical protein